MFTHTVLFWLKPNTPAGVRDQLLADCRTILTRIPAVRALHAGKPAGTDRTVVDNSYSVGLTVIFDDRMAHDIYQEHPLHEQFMQRNKQHWAKIVVYDFA